MKTAVPNVYLICVVRPPGYRHASAFQEIAETLCFGLQRLGCIAAIQENRFAADATNIILGANLIAEKLIDMIPANSILYNLEQIEPTSTWFEPAFQRLLREFAVWDYSARNIERIRQLGDATQIRHLSIGYVSEMSRITAAASQDIDVLFYGSANTRRGKILHALRAAGLTCTPRSMSTAQSATRLSRAPRWCSTCIITTAAFLKLCERPICWQTAKRW